MTARRFSSFSSEGNFQLSDSNWGFKEIVADAKQRVPCCDVHTLKARLDAGESIVIVDVREESEFAKARVSGSIHIGKGILERDIEKHVPDRDALVVCYCGGGSRSALAADNLIRMGYANVISMDGGFRGWSEAGYPVEG